MKTIFNKNKKANAYVVIGVVIIFLLIFGGVFLLSKLKIINSENENMGNEFQKEENNQNPEIQENVQEYCKEDMECEDENKCTLEKCIGGVCIINEVLLCYNDDGCCPKNCNSKNDNDCLGVILE